MADVRRYRKKPVVIEAVLHLGDHGDVAAAEDIARWCGGEVGWGPKADPGILIKTREGTMRADPGDWIIRGVQGEFYPCKPDIFEATYEAVGD